MHSNTKPVRQGCRVKLVSLPTGCMSKHYPLTVGNTYHVLGFEVGNVVTTTDEPGRSASYSRTRVERVE